MSERDKVLYYFFLVADKRKDEIVARWMVNDYTRRNFGIGYDWKEVKWLLYEWGLFKSPEIEVGEDSNSIGWDHKRTAVKQARPKIKITRR